MYTHIYVYVYISTHIYVYIYIGGERERNRYRYIIDKTHKARIITNILLVGASLVKNLPAMREAKVQSLGREDPLEKGMGTRSTILAWRIPWTEKPDGLQSMGLQGRDYYKQYISKN